MLKISLELDAQIRRLSKVSETNRYFVYFNERVFSKILIGDDRNFSYEEKNIFLKITSGRYCMQYQNILWKNNFIIVITNSFSADSNKIYN